MLPGSIQGFFFFGPADPLALLFGFAGGGALAARR